MSPVCHYDSGSRIQASAKHSCIWDSVMVVESCEKAAHLMLFVSGVITIRNILAEFWGSLKSFQKTCTFRTFRTLQS